MIDIDETVRTVSKQLVGLQEAYIIDFFGSREKALELAHLYVFEDHGTVMTQNDEGKYVLTTLRRLRLKTPEELSAEQV